MADIKITENYTLDKLIELEKERLERIIRDKAGKTEWTEAVIKALTILKEYENADLIERNTMSDEIGNKYCDSHCKAEECYSECRTSQLLDCIAEIPRFKPKGETE